MAEHPAVERMRRGYGNFAKGDLDAIRGDFAPDVVWHVGGRSPLAGDYKGVDAVFAFFARLFQETEGTFRSEVHDVLASADHSVALVTQSASRKGKSLTMNAVHIVHRNERDQITESWFFPEDAHALDEFWS